MQRDIGNVSIYLRGKEDTSGQCEIKENFAGAEKQLLETLMKNPGHSEQELLSRSTQYAWLYHLCEERGYVAEIMDIKPESTVLEIGSEGGGVTGALLRRAGSVDCICTNERHAEINACRNQKNHFSIYVGPVETLKLNKQYDVATLIGSLSYAARYSFSDQPFKTLLEFAYSHLAPGGKLYVATENTIGMKFLAGAPYDYLPDAYYNLQNPEASTERSRYRTFTRSQLETILRKAGFGDFYFYYPYPDYKFPSMIFSDDMYMESSYINAGKEYQYERFSVFNESMAYISLSGSEEIRLLANSFLVEAKKAGENEKL